MGSLFKEKVIDGMTLPIPLNCPNCRVNNTWVKLPKSILAPNEPHRFKCVKCGCEATMNKEVLPVKYDDEVIE